MLDFEPNFLSSQSPVFFPPQISQTLRSYQNLRLENMESYDPADGVGIDEELTDTSWARCLRVGTGFDEDDAGFDSESRVISLDPYVNAAIVYRTISNHFQGCHG